MGITCDLEQRRKQNSKTYGFKIKDFDFIDQVEKGWHALLYEQVVRHRCERFMLSQKLELFWYDVPVEVIIHAYENTKNFLSSYLDWYDGIHLIEDRKERDFYYREIADGLGAYSGKIKRNTQQFYVP